MNAIAIYTHDDDDLPMPEGKVLNENKNTKL